MSDDQSEEEEVTDLSNSDVCTKYQEAAKIVNESLKGVIGQCVVGAKILQICEFGHTILDAQAQKIYQKKVNGRTIDRGVAFPVCVSVNDVVCNYSPLKTDETEPLKAGDIVKIDLGCHIDGYIAVAAHTMVVSESPDDAPKPDDDTSKVAVATYNTMLVAAQAIAAGAKNAEVTKVVERVAGSYGVTPIATARMHQMKRYVLDGVKEVALKHNEEEQLEDCEFEQFEVYAVDVAMSTGDGNARPGDSKVTIFKRNVEVQYQLKIQASRQLIAEVDKNFPTLPFTMRHLQDVRRAKLGLTENVNHGLLTPYPTMHDHSGKTAHFKCTVLLLPSGTARVTGLPLPEYFDTDIVPDEETVKVLNEIKEAEAKKAARKAAKAKKKKAKK